MAIKNSIIFKKKGLVGKLKLEVGQKKEIAIEKIMTLENSQCKIKKVAISIIKATSQIHKLTL